MKVRDLIEMLENLDGDKQIVFKPTNCEYVYDIDDCSIRNDHHIKAFGGNDFNAYVVVSFEQVGADWGRDN